MRYLTFILLVACPAFAEDDPAPKITFDEHVQPILRQKCAACHNPDKRSGDLDMSNYTNLMQGGGSGAVIEPGDSSSSYLYMLVTHEEEPTMPPESPKIADDLLATIREWIDGGALENASSESTVARRKKKVMAASSIGERPENVALPGRMDLEPFAPTSSRGAINQLATSPWGPLVAIASHKQVLLYRTDTTELTGILPFPEGLPHALRFSRDGALLLAGGGQGASHGRVVVWDVRSGERIWEIGDELDTVLAADVSADLSQISLGSPQRVVRTYNTETGELIREIRKHTEWITALAYSPDGVLLATADRNGGLNIWETHTGREYLTLGGHGGAITGLSWRADSNVLASCGEDGAVRLWEMENGNQVKTFTAHGGGTTSVEFTRDGRLVSAGRDRTVKLWQSDGTNLQTFEALADLALGVTFCDETNRVIGADWSGEIRVYNAVDGNRIAQLEANPPTLATQFELAQAQLDQQLVSHNPLQTRFDELTNQRQSLTDNVKQNDTTVAELQQQIASSQEVVNKLRQEIDSENAAKTEAASTITSIEVSLDDLKRAAASARAAADTSPEDNDLAKVVTELEQLVQQRNDRMEKAREQAGQIEETLPEKDKLLAGAQQEVEQRSAELAAATARQAQLSTELATAETNLTELTPQLDTSRQTLEQLQASVSRWQNEIEFSRQLAGLRQRRAEAQQATYEAETTLDQLQEDAKQAASRLDEKQQALDGVKRELAALQEIK